MLHTVSCTTYTVWLMDGASMNPPIISVRGLQKSYGSKPVLQGVDFDVPAGSIFALLGQNGAGKTTTINVLTTLVPADAGDATIAGFDLRREAASVKTVISVTGQN